MLAFRLRRSQLCDRMKRDSAVESSLLTSTLVTFRAELYPYCPALTEASSEAGWELPKGYNVPQIGDMLSLLGVSEPLAGLFESTRGISSLYVRTLAEQGEGYGAWSGTA